MKHIKAIDGLRAWMAWWVVSQHLLQVSGVAAASGNIAVRLLTMGGLGVMVFVIISGFVITHLLCNRDEAYRLYVARRFFRIYPPLIVALTLMVILRGQYQVYFVDNAWTPHNLISQFADEQLHFPAHVALHLLLLHGLVPDTILPGASLAILGPAWSISLEWQFYLVAPLIMRFAFHRLWRARIMACAAIALGMILAYAVGGARVWNYPAMLPLTIGYFLLGMTTRIALGAGAIQWRMLALPLLIAAANVGLYTAAYGYGKFAFGLIPIGIWAGIVWGISRPEQTGGLARTVVQGLFGNRAVVNLGVWSYSTYLLHIPLFVAALSIGGWLLPHMGSVDRMLILLATCPVVVVVSWLSYRWVERPSTAIVGEVFKWRAK